MNAFSKPNQPNTNDLPKFVARKYIFLGFLVNVLTTLTILLFSLPSTGRLTQVLPRASEWGNFTFAEWFPIVQALLGFFLLTVILVPIIEELIFRSGLQNLLKRIFGLTGILLSVLIFAWLHGGWSAVYVLPGALLMAYAYERHKLNASVPAHVGFNLTGFVIGLLSSL
jgi:membrane protease YdiL (CAAX protease family)